MTPRPLPALLCTLTADTGVVDAVSFLGLGHVFVGIMTGNLVFLGFAAAGAADLTVAAPLAAIGAFTAGAFAGGTLATRVVDRTRLLGIGVAVKIALTAAALAVAALWTIGGPSRFVLIVLLALAGLGAALVLRMGIASALALAIALLAMSAVLVRRINP